MDNVPVDPGVKPGAQPIATDDVGGVQYQRVKLDVGGDGLTVPVVGALPVTGPLTDLELRALPVPVSGTVATGGLTDVELRASPVPVSGPVTDVQLRAVPVPVSGTVATGGLTDAQLRAVPVPVSGTVATGGLTDVQMRASPVPVSGPLTNTELRAVAVPVSGTVAVTGPLTDAQLRATAVPVSGTVTATGPLTDTQLRASNVNVTASNFLDGIVMDAFGRIRTSDPQTIFEITHNYDLNIRRMGQQRQDAATTITFVRPTAVLAVPAVAGRRICHQSHRYHIYQPGHSQYVKVTGQLGDTTILAGMGYGDDNDGIFIERTSTGFQIRLSSTTTADELVLQANWNLDKLNGTGVSGVTLNGSFSQQFLIDLQWLGVGRVRCGFVISGKLIYCHEFNFSNTITGAYMISGDQPLRWYAESLGAAGSMTSICGCVISEGGHNPEGSHFTYAMTTAKALGAAGVRTPLMTMRPKLTFAGIANHAQIFVRSVSAMSVAADNILLETVLNGALTGATFAVDPNSLSHAEVDLAATAIAITAGTSVVTWSDLISQTSRSLQSNDVVHFPLTLQADGTTLDTVTICGTRIGGAASIFACANWEESF